MTTLTTPNMKLVVPNPGSEPGPAWASEIAVLLNLVDQHDHSSTRGVAVSTAGLSINANLPFGGFGQTAVGFVALSALAAPPQLRTLYVDVSGELHYIDGAGNDLRLTLAGTFNLAAVSGFNGQYASDPLFPSAFYTTSAKRYTFTTNGATLAQVRLGSLLVGVLSTAIAAAVADNDNTHTVAVNTAANVTITLPLAANNPGRQITVKDSTGGAPGHNITITRTSTDTIDGTTSQTISAARGVLRLVSDGVSQWMVV